jgi:hypothetical protein
VRRERLVGEDLGHGAQRSARSRRRRGAGGAR